MTTPADVSAHRARVPWPIIVVAFFGFAAVLVGTRQGIALSPDSLVYIQGARNLLLGNGYSELRASGLIPITHNPPLFPMLLAAAGTAGVDPLDGARWLNAFFFGGSILLVGLIIHRDTRGSVWTSLLGSFLILTASDLLALHVTAMAEPGFIFFSLAALYLLAVHVEKSKPRLLISAALLVAAAFLTRYIGVALVISGVVGLLLVSRERYSRRIQESLLFGLIAALPVAAWVLRNRIVSGSMSDMKMEFHPIPLSQLNGALSVLASWLLPEKALRILGLSPAVVVTAILVGILLLWLWSRQRRDPNVALIRSSPIRSWLLLFIGVYCVALAFFIAFVSLTIFFDSRHLLAVHAAAIALFLPWARDASGLPERGRLVRIGAAAFCVALAGSYLIRGATGLITAHAVESGYASRAWKESELLARVRALPSGTRIYSNRPSVVIYFTGRPAFGFPAKVDVHTGRVNTQYRAELSSIKERLGTQPTALVFFRTLDSPVQPSESELRAALPLRLIAAVADGSLYEVRIEGKATMAADGR